MCFDAFGNVFEVCSPLIFLVRLTVVLRKDIWNEGWSISIKLRYLSQWWMWANFISVFWIFYHSLGNKGMACTLGFLQLVKVGCQCDYPLWSREHHSLLWLSMRVCVCVSPRVVLILGWWLMGFYFQFGSHKCLTSFLQTKSLMSLILISFLAFKNLESYSSTHNEQREQNLISTKESHF